MPIQSDPSHVCRICSSARPPAQIDGKILTDEQRQCRLTRCIGAEVGVNIKKAVASFNELQEDSGRQLDQATLQRQQDADYLDNLKRHCLAGICSHSNPFFHQVCVQRAAARGSDLRTVVISTKHPRSASADTLGSRLCQDCLAAVASRLQTTESGEVCLRKDHLLSRPPTGPLKASTDLCVCLHADVLGRLRSEKQRRAKGFSLSKQRLTRKACKKLVAEHHGVFAFLCMQQDGTVSYSLPDGMEEDFPVQAAQLTSAWDSFALESTAPQQRQQQQAGHQVSAAPGRGGRSGAPPDGSASGAPPADSVQDIETAAPQYDQPLQALSEPAVSMPQLPGQPPPPFLVPEPLDPGLGPGPPTLPPLPRQQAARRAQGRSEAATGAKKNFSRWSAHRQRLWLWHPCRASPPLRASSIAWHRLMASAQDNDRSL